ncbi:AbrB/MazE/SpoVT family DNA-binding domain-containing protein [Virgibacillus sp. NKC19-3]|nr:AbrB/MazE/SpoVT family DNA-binding domain-containing protein [Virgibacillus sp. NKC19-3]
MNKNSMGRFNVTTTVQKWGGSTGIRIPQHIAKKYNIVPGTEVQISDDGEKVVLTPVKDVPTLEELVAKCTPENSHEEIDFSGPTGRELI